MSMEFDKKIQTEANVFHYQAQNWSKYDKLNDNMYSTDHKNGFENCFEHFWSKLRSSDFQSHFPMSKII